MKHRRSSKLIVRWSILANILKPNLLLAKQKTAHKNDNKNKLVSEVSRTAAELISRKEEKKFYKKCHAVVPKENPTSIEKLSTSESRDTDEESEYLPSCDEDDSYLALPIKRAADPSLPCSSSASRSNKNVKKIIDDGDRNFYDQRLKVWRENLSAAGKNEQLVTNINSADIQYLLDGNKDVEENHQLKGGLRIPNFIWSQLYKYQKTGVKWLWELHQLQSGGLLGDEMGLGKTVQIIAFLAGLANTDSGSWGGLGPSIIVAPATVMYQWVTHFHYWCPYLRVAVLHNSGSHVGSHNKLIRDIHHSHGILLITYAGIVKYSKDLLTQKWHYIILDEGHKIRNPNTQVSKHIKKFQTPHRLLITGSPMQNSLQELWSLFDFMSPGLLGTYHAFMEHFTNPITQGGYANATELQEATALEIAKALKSLITPYMLRRTKAEVQEHIKLPEKTEQVLFCALSQEQKDLYMGYLMGSTVRSILDKETRFGDPLRARVLVALTTLRKICNHPDLYLHEMTEDVEPTLNEDFGYWKRSGKMSVVNSLLKIWQKQGHRTLIFSQSRAMICILEQYLQDHNYKYLKMDGSVAIGQRQSLIKTYNENSEYLVFLSTTRVGGLGVNLTGADRVIVYDPDWNPATDNQAKERAWRIGQERNVTVYRLLSAGTIEEKIYQRQIFKHFLGNRILVDPNQKNVLSTSTLQGLFTLEELNKDGDTETASLFKHTKVTASNNKKSNDKIQSSKGISFSRKKIDAMKKRAKEISDKISRTASESNAAKEDPREKYKKKRELLLKPPEEPVIPEINLVDDTITTATFENVMSELDIINMHAKKNYEEELIQKVLNEKSKNNEEKDEILEHTECNDEVKEEGEINSDDNPDDIQSPTTTRKHARESDNPKEVNQTRKRKRKDSFISEEEIDGLLAIEKVKKKKQKRDKQVKNEGDDDDYVLNKLFAKASVKSALQHDAVVGLAEKEKRLRLKEEASKVVKTAMRAIKFSTSKKSKSKVIVI